MLTISAHYAQYFCHPIMLKLCWYNRLKPSIHGKAFTVACLYTHIVNQHGHRSTGKHSWQSKSPQKFSYSKVLLQRYGTHKDFCFKISKCIQYGKIGIINLMSTNLNLIQDLYFVTKVATNYTAALSSYYIYSYIMIQRVSRPYCPKAYFAIFLSGNTFYSNLLCSIFFSKFSRIASYLTVTSYILIPQLHNYIYTHHGEL